MADMLTNTVGIMLFILIFASLSAGGATIYKHLPLERTTKAEAVWMLCSGGRIVSFDPDALGKQITEGLGKPTFSNADNWAQRFAAKKFETDTLAVEGNATATYMGGFFQQSVRLCAGVGVRRKAGGGEDAAAIRAQGSKFRRLLAGKNRTKEFFFFFVHPDSVALFRTARDQAAAAGFNVGWDPLGANEPARVSIIGGCGSATKID